MALGLLCMVLQWSLGMWPRQGGVTAKMWGCRTGSLVERDMSPPLWELWVAFEFGGTRYGFHSKALWAVWSHCGSQGGALRMGWPRGPSHWLLLCHPAGAVRLRVASVYSLGLEFQRPGLSPLQCHVSLETSQGHSREAVPPGGLEQAAAPGAIRRPSSACSWHPV